MTRRRLAAWSAIGAAMWALFFYAGFTIGWALFGQYIVGVIVVLLCIGATWRNFSRWRVEYLSRKREQELWDARQLEEEHRRLDRQRRLLAIADLVESAPEHEKQRLQREAEALGFFDDDSRMVS